MDRASSFNVGQRGSDDLYDAVALTALEARRAWVDALLSAALYGAKYSMAATTFMGTGIDLLSALTHCSDRMIFGLDVVDPSDKPSDAEPPHIDDLTDHLCESRAPFLSPHVLAYSVVR
jgi:hypothetical protein